MIRYYIIYDKTSITGVKRSYRKEFDDLDKAFEYARKKESEPRVENVRGVEHDEQDGVTYVFRLAI